MRVLSLLICLLLLLGVAYGQKPDRSFGTVRTDTMRYSDGTWQVTAVNTAPYTINILSYGADPTGSSDSRVAVQRALDSAFVHKGTVYAPNGVYLLTAVSYAGSNVCLVIKSGVTLQGAGMDATIFKRAAHQANDNRMIYSGGTNDSSITVRDLTLDGNGVNQTSSGTWAQYGLCFVHVNDAYVVNVKSKDHKGTGASGSGDESMAFEVNVSYNVSFTSCIAQGGDSSSTGFSADASTSISFTNCTATGFYYGSGFTHNACSGVSYTNCSAGDNPHNNGFNSEVSDNIWYTDCIAGMKVITATGRYSAGDTLKNNCGFGIAGNTGPVMLSNCIGQYSTYHGVYLSAGAKDVRIVGGVYRYNENFGINGPSTQGKMFVADALCSNNTIGALAENGVVSPVFVDSAFVVNKPLQVISTGPSQFDCPVVVRKTTAKNSTQLQLQDSTGSVISRWTAGEAAVAPVKFGTVSADQVDIMTHDTSRVSISGTGVITLPTSSMTSATLGGALTDETGAGVVVFHTAPTLSAVTVIGKPASIVLRPTTKNGQSIIEFRDSANTGGWAFWRDVDSSGRNNLAVRNQASGAIPLAIDSLSVTTVANGLRVGIVSSAAKVDSIKIISGSPDTLATYVGSSRFIQLKNP